jgi:hypothetical protein
LSGTAIALLSRQGATSAPFKGALKTLQSIWKSLNKPLRKRKRIMRKRIILTGILSIMLVAGVVCLSAGESRAADFLNCWSESYFQNHPMTVQQMTDQYGKAAKIIDLEDGKKDYVYKKFENNSMLESTRHFIVKEGKVLKSFLKD